MSNLQPNCCLEFDFRKVDQHAPTSNDKSTKWVPSLFYVSFLISFFLKLIVACRLCVIYVREDNDSNV